MKLSSTSLVARLTLLALILGFVAGCSPSDSAAKESSGAATPAAASAAPRVVQTKSGIRMVAVPGGEFLMGTDRGNPDESPAHRVKVSPFLMDMFEVTHEMLAAVQLPNPSHWQDQPSKPVERVRWRDAKQYCNERSLAEGLKPCYNEKTAEWDCDYSANGYRLPTEAEWEYACRAGSEGAYDFGGADRLKQHAWFSENAGERTHKVGEKKPNAWGLHDLYGNVSEWCEDVYDAGYYARSEAVDPKGPKSTGKDVLRVMRGGSWKSTATMARATFRQGQRTGDSDACFFTDFCGFRCVRRATEEELKTMPVPAPAPAP